MSRNLTEGLNYYTVVLDLNSRRLNDSLVGHCSMQWKTMMNALGIYGILVLGIKS